MASRRSQASGTSPSLPLLFTKSLVQFLTIFLLCVYLINNYGIGTTVDLQKIEDQPQALLRHKALLGANQVVGERMADIKSGNSQIYDIVKDEDEDNDGNVLTNSKNPMPMDEVLTFLNDFIANLHQRFIGHKQADYFEIWSLFHDYALEILYPWDQEYIKRMPERRSDGSIFLSIATYRDENCFNTISGAYGKSKNPDMLNVGLVQQNCLENCRSGILDGTGRMEDVPPDDDCYTLFCQSELGRPHCEAGRVRQMLINEPESLGPYFARYIASKLWNGEQWFMQIDAHMYFLQDWDAESIEMLKAAPSKKPVISHYPPPEEYKFANSATRAAPRLCGPVFAAMDLENQVSFEMCSLIVREYICHWFKKSHTLIIYSPFIDNTVRRFECKFSLLLIFRTLVRLISCTCADIYALISARMLVCVLCESCFRTMINYS